MRARARARACVCACVCVRVCVCARARARRNKNKILYKLLYKYLNAPLKCFNKKFTAKIKCVKNNFIYICIPVKVLMSAQDKFSQ